MASRGSSKPQNQGKYMCWEASGGASSIHLADGPPAESKAEISPPRGTNPQYKHLRETKRLALRR